MKLTKDQTTALDDLRATLATQHAALDTALDAYNAAVAAAFATLTEAVTTYNEALGEAHDHVTSLTEELRNDWQEKSEKWQESPKGEAADTWIGTYDDWYAEDFEPDAPEELVAPDVSDLELDLAASDNE